MGKKIVGAYQLAASTALFTLALLACPWSGPAQEYVEPLSNRELGVSIDHYTGELAELGA